MRGILLVAVVGLGCGPKHQDAPKHQGAATAGKPISLVPSMVVVESCPDSRKLDSRVATREIEELVGPCKKVPGGVSHFSATLAPDGSIELASPTGDPNEGTVPTCVVGNAAQLRHKLRLTSPCKFDVKLEQRTDARQ